MKTMVAIAMLALPQLTLGQVVTNHGQEFTPYEEIALHMESEMSHLNNRILYFVHFTCPYCRNSHGAIREWGAGIPGSHDFEVIPAIGTEEHLVQGVGYYAALVAAPELIRAYEASCYRMLQDARLSANDPNTYLYAAMDAGIDRQAFLEAAESKQVKSYVRRALMLTAVYRLQEVPVVILANRFVAKPASVQNQNDAFITVLNGLFSMHYQELRVTR